MNKKNFFIIILFLSLSVWLTESAFTVYADVPGEFTLVGTDPDDGMKIDIDKVYASSNAEKLSFKLTTYRQWEENMFVYLDIDADRDLNTGDPDTGVDYEILVIMENGIVIGGLLIYDTVQEEFILTKDLDDVICEANSDVCQASVMLSDIGNPDVIDFGVMIGTEVPEFEFDFAPKEGFYTYSLEEVPSQTYSFTVDLSEFHNSRLQDIRAEYPEGDVTLGTIPFSISTGGNNIWSSNYSDPNPHQIDISVGISGVSKVYTLINTDWGQNSSKGSFAAIEFYGSEGASFKKELYGNVDIRDWQSGGWTNSINETTTINVFKSSDGQFRLDMQTIDLPDDFLSQTLEMIRVIDTGGQNLQRIFLAGITVESVEPAEVPVVDNALSLDGDGDYVDCGNDAGLNFGTGDFSIEVWVKASVIDKEVVNKRHAAIDIGYYLSTYGARVQGSDDALLVSPSDESAICDGNWHHLAMTKTATTLRFYVDGIEDANSPSITTGTGDTDSGTNLFIGKRINPGEELWLNGLIDEVRIWNVARAQDEIQANMYNELTGSEAGLVAYYDFDEPVGSTLVHDRTANGNDGTLYGDAQFVESTRPTEPVADTTPPVITSGPDVSNITTTSAVVTWHTDEASSSVVEYGTEPEYGLTAEGEDNVTEHSVPLSSLSPDTAYYYRVGSTDASDNTVWSEQKTFKTSAEVVIEYGWTEQLSGTEKDLRTVYFVNTQVGWCLSGYGPIFHTTDGGTTWTSQGEEFSNTILEDIYFVDANNGWAVGEEGTIIHTTDGGKTWVKQDTAASKHLMSTFFDDLNNGWAIDSTPVLHTTDGGATWEEQIFPKYTKDGYENDAWIGGFYFLDSQNAIAVDRKGALYRSTDGGATWTLEAVGELQPFDWSMVVEKISFIDANNAWAIVKSDGSTFLFKTTDGGLTWVKQEVETDDAYLVEIQFVDAQNGWVVGRKYPLGVIFYTTDGGVTWNTKDISQAPGDVYFVDAGNGWVVGDKGFVLRYRGEAEPIDETPPVIKTGPSASDITQTSAVIEWTTDEVSSSVVEYGTGPEYGLTAEGEDNVTEHSVPLSSLSPDTTYYYRIGSTDASGNTVWSEQKTFKTLEEKPLKGDVDNDGEISSDDAILVLRIVAMLIEPTDEQKQAADMNDDGVIRSNDAILILRKAAGLAAPSKELIAAIERTITVMLEEVHGVAGESIIVPLKVDDIHELAGGDIRINYDQAVLRPVDVSSDSDLLLTCNIAESGIIRIAFANAEVLSNKTVAKIRFEVLADDVSPLTLQKVKLYNLDAFPLDSRKSNAQFSSWAIPPEHSALLQNFPNPFNPETWIPYQLKKGSEVTIQIYSVAGELVRKLELGYRPAGLYVSRDRALHWDGRNKYGALVASGVYFYNIQAGDFTAMRKLIVLK